MRFARLIETGAFQGGGEKGVRGGGKGSVLIKYSLSNSTTYFQWNSSTSGEGNFKKSQKCVTQVKDLLFQLADRAFLQGMTNLPPPPPRTTEKWQFPATVTESTHMCAPESDFSTCPESSSCFTGCLLAAKVRKIAKRPLDK